MSLEHAKVMTILLRKVLKQHEDQQGTPIVLHPQIYTQMGISRQEDWGGIEMVNNNKVITSTIEMGRPTVVAETPQVMPKCARTDFFQALKKVSQRRSVPIGENVRDAIKSIKGKQD